VCACRICLCVISLLVRLNKVKFGLKKGPKGPNTKKKNLLRIGTSFTKGENSSLKWTTWQRVTKVRLEAQARCSRVRFSYLPFTFGSQKMWFLFF
jgi:hypothetical protein